MVHNRLQAIWRRLFAIPLSDGEVETGRHIVFADVGKGFSFLNHDVVHVTNKRIVISRSTIATFGLIGLVLVSLLFAVLKFVAGLVVLCVGWMIVLLRMRRIVLASHHRADLTDCTVKKASLFERDQLVLSFALGPSWKLTAAGRGQKSVESIRTIFIGTTIDEIPRALAAPRFKVLKILILLAGWVFGTVLVNSFLYRLFLYQKAPHEAEPATGNSVDVMQHGMHYYLRQDDLARVSELQHIGFFGVGFCGLLFAILYVIETNTSGYAENGQNLPLGKWLGRVPVIIAACSVLFWIVRAYLPW